MAGFVTAMKNIAAADPSNVAVVNLGDTFAPPTAGNGHDGGNFATNNVHPTTQGHAAIAQVLGVTFGT